MVETLVKILNVLEIISMILLLVSVLFYFYNERHGNKREKLAMVLLYVTLGFGIATIFVSGLLAIVG